jgi:hypothetical protein
MPLLFKSTHPIDDSQPYCYGTIEVSDVDLTVYAMPFTLIAVSAATADTAIRNIAIALETLTNLKLKSVEAAMKWDKIEGDNPIPAYGNQRENQGILEVMLPHQKRIEVAFPNPHHKILSVINPIYLDLSHPDLAAFINHLKSGKVLVKNQVPLFYLGGHIRHVASGKNSEIFTLR